MMSAEDVMNAFGLTDDASGETTEEKKEPQQKKETKNTESPSSIFGDDGSESVGGSEKQEEASKVPDNKSGSSQNNFSSIARTLKEFGTFEDLSDEDLDAIQDGESLIAAIDKQARARFDERQKRIDDALTAGVEPSAIKQYETILANLDQLEEDTLKAETDNAVALRKNLIFQDFLNRGYSKERAEKEVTKSFNAGTDVEDALDALESNKDFYTKSYNNLIKEHNDAIEAQRKEIQEQAEKLKHSIMEDDKAFNDLVVDKATRKKILDSISKPVYRDPKTQRSYTAIQKYALDNPADFQKNLGLVFTLTNGFKDFNGLIKGPVKKELKEKIKQMESVINTSKRTGDVNLFGGNSFDENESFPAWKIGDF